MPQITIVDVQVDEEFRRLMPASTDYEFNRLRQNIFDDRRFTDPLIVWDKTVIDGHQRLEIYNDGAMEIGIPAPEIVEIDLPSREAAINWIVDHQLGRRNLPKSQRDYLIGKKYNLEKGDKKENLKTGSKSPKGKSCPSGETGRKPPKTRKSTAAEKVAKQAKISPRSVKQHGEWSKALDVIAQINFKFAEDVRTGTIKAPKKAIVTLGKMQPGAMGEAILDQVAPLPT